ncbi:Cell wall / vacuolar inhibitor of fructosidase [Arachis hypogaea]|nr:Cell wall / vacuolar inhibitor of fructosidase [Arachis hypogaea]
MHQLRQSTIGRLGAFPSCIGHYNGGILKGDLPQAISRIETDNTKFAESILTDAVNEAYSCEQGFNGSSPLSKENNAVRDPANIAKVIVITLY